MLCAFCSPVEFYSKKTVGVFVMWGKHREGLMRGSKLVWFLHFLSIRISTRLYTSRWSIANHRLFKSYWDMAPMSSTEGARWVGNVSTSLNRADFIGLAVRTNHLDELWGPHFKIRINFLSFKEWSAFSLQTEHSSPVLVFILGRRDTVAHCSTDQGWRKSSRDADQEWSRCQCTEWRKE